MTNADNLILSYECAAAVTKGQLVKLDTDGKLALVAAVEATDAIGIAYSTGAIGDFIGVIVKGVIDAVPVLVEDTDGASGYDKAIVRGDFLIIAGKASGTYDVGQALSAVGGTAQTTAVEGMVVGKALEAVAGSTTADTYTTIKAYVNFMV